MSSRKTSLTRGGREQLMSRVKSMSSRTRSETASSSLQPALPAEVTEFNTLAGYEELRILRNLADKLGIESPFFRSHDARAGARSLINGRELINFSSFDYLGLNGHPEVHAAAKAAIDRYGFSTSASQLVAGERPIHRALEYALARHYSADDCAIFVSGYATNVGVIGHLLSDKDIIIHDALVDNSVLTGATLSRAARRSFPHNDLDALEGILGYIAGATSLIEYLKCKAGIFVYSAGVPPLIAAGCLRALEIMHAEPERVSRLKRNARLFKQLVDEHGLNTGSTPGTAISPIIVRDSLLAVVLSQRLAERGVNVQPVIYSAVPAKASRLRFFITSEHNESDIDEAVSILADEFKQLTTGQLSVALRAEASALGLRPPTQLTDTTRRHKGCPPDLEIAPFARRCWAGGAGGGRPGSGRGNLATGPLYLNHLTFAAHAGTSRLCQRTKPLAR
jgi:7-keto-8-aminopelargonate synthetase-like enzyme